MGTALTAATIGKNTTFAPDRILSAEVLEDSGTTTSAEFLFAQTLGRIEVRFVAHTAIAAGTDTIVCSLVTASATGGTFDNTVASVTATGSYAAGDTIAAIVAPQELAECYTKATLVTDYAAGTATESVDVMVIEV